MIYTFEQVENELYKKGYVLRIDKSNFKGVTVSELFCVDFEGYKYNICYSRLMSGKIPDRFNKSNKYTIDNINHYLEINKIPFVCLSDEYINNTIPLKFQCLRCNEIIEQSWININRNDSINRKHLVCWNCDGNNESIHALVLKQMFLYNYSDTIVEDESCINPQTNKIMPTDIVNHRLKIAIEVQSQWHDLKERKIRDAYKKQFWINRGYDFFDPDIRDYSVLEMCQLFFDIVELPSYINYDYNHKLNIKNIQQLLNNKVSVPEIAKKLNINKHRIYDAIYCNKLVYPVDYKDADLRPVAQYDMNGVFIKLFISISEASHETGISRHNICAALKRKSHYSSGYYWFDKTDYENGNAKVISGRFLKFNIPVNKYDMHDNYISSYNSIFEASKDLNVSNYQIWKVVSGELHSIKKFVFKKAS